MRITNEMIYNELQEIKEKIASIPLIKWMAGSALTISVAALCAIAAL